MIRTVLMISSFCCFLLPGETGLRGEELLTAATPAAPVRPGLGSRPELISSLNPSALLRKMETSGAFALASVHASADEALPPRATSPADSIGDEPLEKTSDRMADMVASLRRSVTQVTLKSATELKVRDGESPQVPEDLAGEFYARFGSVRAPVMVPGVPPTLRNFYPICHNPLYFEDPNMERCGQGFGCLTEGVSAIRFFGRIPLLPGMMAANPPCSQVRALPYCPSCQKFGCDAYLPPLSARVATWEAAAAVGLIFLIP